MLISCSTNDSVVIGNLIFGIYFLGSTSSLISLSLFINLTLRKSQFPLKQASPEQYNDFVEGESGLGILQSHKMIELADEASKIRKTGEL